MDFTEKQQQILTILRTPADELDEEGLFRKYYYSFRSFNTKGMIEAKKSWSKRFKKGQKFHHAYIERVG